MFISKCVGLFQTNWLSGDAPDLNRWDATCKKRADYAAATCNVSRHYAQHQEYTTRMYKPYCWKPHWCI